MKNSVKFCILVMLFCGSLTPLFLHAQGTSEEERENGYAKLKQLDTDKDGLSDYDELYIYRSFPGKEDSDGDGYSDGSEVAGNYDPNMPGDERLGKVIGVSLQNQTLTYSLGSYVINTIKISSGLPRTPTPPGEYSILVKKPLVTYRGFGYFYPNTKWNMMFKRGNWGNYYIHGAFWHNNFGRPMSHGCVNVSYSDMEKLYNWADESTRVIIE